MDTIRQKSLETGVPFWNVIQSNAHFFYAEPYDAMMALQVYSALAYGSKGIGYFTYYTSPYSNSRLAPIDRFGYRTNTWEIIRNLNLQIHALYPVYCRLKSVNVCHTDDFPRGNPPSKFVKILNSNAPLLIGEFEDNDGKPYVMVVNKNLQNSIELNLVFKGYEKSRIKVVSPYIKGDIELFDEGRNWLSPGFGILLTVD